MSTLKADTIQSTSGGAATLTKQIAAKAFGVFDQRGDKLGANTGGDTFNVSSFSDMSTGIFSTSLTNNMSSTQYASITNSHYSGLDGGIHNNTGDTRFSASSTYASGSFSTASQYQHGTNQDNYFTINVHGDLA